MKTYDLCGLLNDNIVIYGCKEQSLKEVYLIYINSTELAVNKETTGFLSHIQNGSKELPTFIY